MNITKLQEAIAELRAEAAESLRLADDLEARIKRSANGGSPKRGRTLKHSSGPENGDGQKSYLTLAVEVLREEKRPMHIKEVTERVAGLRGEATRSQVESALVRGMKAGKWHSVIRRTKPGTFTVTQ